MLRFWLLLRRYRRGRRRGGCGPARQGGGAGRVGGGAGRVGVGRVGRVGGGHGAGWAGWEGTGGGWPGMGRLVGTFVWPERKTRGGIGENTHELEKKCKNAGENKYNHCKYFSVLPSSTSIIDFDEHVLKIHQLTGNWNLLHKNPTTHHIDLHKGLHSSQRLQPHAQGLFPLLSEYM